MPIYRYKDKKGNIYEAFQKINDKPLKKIDGIKVKKVPASASFELKGKGFYKNDY